jgi:hypothetical protein
MGIRFLVSGLVLVALAMACAGASVSERIQEAEGYLEIGEVDRAIKGLSPLVERGEDDPGIQLTLAKAIFAKSVYEMDGIEDLKFQFDMNRVINGERQRLLLDGARKADRIHLDIKMGNGVQVGEAIVAGELVYGRETGGGWIRSPLGGDESEPFLTLPDIWAAAPRLMISNFDGRPTRANLDEGTFSVSGSVDARLLADELLRNGQIGPAKADLIADTGTLSLQVWLASFEKPQWRRIRLDESYDTEQGRMIGTSAIELDLVTLVSDIALPPPYSHVPGRPVYGDDFTNPASGFSTVASDPAVRALRYVPESHEFAAAILEPSGSSQRGVSTSTLLAARTFQDLAIEVDVRPTELLRSGAYSLCVRCARPSAGYELLVSVTGSYQVRRLAPAGTVVLQEWTPSHALSPRGNHLMVVAVGNQLSFYANGFLLFEARDDTYASGQIGLGVTGWLQPIEGRFSNLQIYEP